MSTVMPVRFKDMTLLTSFNVREYAQVHELIVKRVEFRRDHYGGLWLLLCHDEEGNEGFAIRVSEPALGR